jgi:hypothetical protein
MSYRDLKADFEQNCHKEQLYSISAEVIGNDTLMKAEEAERTYRYWLLKLLFEIHGDLDSLTVAYRELVKMQKERAK